MRAARTRRSRESPGCTARTTWPRSSRPPSVPCSRRGDAACPAVSVRSKRAAPAASSEGDGATKAAETPAISAWFSKAISSSMLSLQRISHQSNPRMPPMPLARPGRRSAAAEGPRDPPQAGQGLARVAAARAEHGRARKMCAPPRRDSTARRSTWTIASPILDVYRPIARHGPGGARRHLFASRRCRSAPRAREALIARARPRRRARRRATRSRSSRRPASSSALRREEAARRCSCCARWSTSPRACARATSRTRPSPPGVWQDMHELYLLRRREGIAGEVGDAETKSTVHDAYMRGAAAVAHRSLSPGPGRGREDPRAGCARMRGLVTLGQARPATRPGGHFLVPCDTDRPPKPLLSANDDTGGPNWRLLDANPIVDKLRAAQGRGRNRQRLGHDEQGAGPRRRSRSSARLITLWGDPPKRAHRRDPMDTTVAICVGPQGREPLRLLRAAHATPQAEADASKRGITMPLMACPTTRRRKRSRCSNGTW